MEDLIENPKSMFVIKINDSFCEWEFGFTKSDACIYDFIQAIEEKLGIEHDYGKLILSYKDAKNEIQ